MNQVKFSFATWKSGSGSALTCKESQIRMKATRICNTACNEIFHVTIRVIIIISSWSITFLESLSWSFSMSTKYKEYCIREKYRLHRICASHLRGWQISVETPLDCGVYRDCIQRETLCMGLYAGVDYNLTLCDRLQHMYHGKPYVRVDLNPMPESTLSPSQGLRIWPLGRAPPPLHNQQIHCHPQPFSHPLATFGQLLTRCPILIVLVTFWDALASTFIYGKRENGGGGGGGG